MNVVDSCGWLEYLADGPNADFFAPALVATDTLVVPTLCMYEVFKCVLAQFSRAEALDMLTLMRQGTVVALNEPVALEAALISRELKLAMADSVILATTRRYNALLWTQDAHFENLDGVRYCPKNYC